MKAGRPEKSNRTDFASRLRELRETTGLSQQQVASRLGISQPSYADWERRNVALRFEQLMTLARLFGVQIKELFLTITKNIGVVARKEKQGKLLRWFQNCQDMKKKDSRCSKCFCCSS